MPSIVCKATPADVAEALLYGATTRTQIGRFVVAIDRPMRGIADVSQVLAAITYMAKARTWWVWATNTCGVCRRAYGLQVFAAARPPAAQTLASPCSLTPRAVEARSRQAAARVLRILLT